VVGNPNEECQQDIATYEMKQIAMDEEVPLEYILRGICPTIIRNKLNLML
jgi:hypothetical protein